MPERAKAIIESQGWYILYRPTVIEFLDGQNIM